MSRLRIVKLRCYSFEQQIMLPPCYALTISFTLAEDNRMADEAQTQPMLQTILERINAIDVKMDERFASLDERLEGIESQLDERSPLRSRLALMFENSSPI